MKKTIIKRISAVAIILALGMMFLTGCGGESITSEDFNFSLPDGTNISSITSDEATASEDDVAGVAIEKEGSFAVEFKADDTGNLEVGFTYKDYKITFSMDDTGIGLKLSEADK